MAKANDVCTTIIGWPSAGTCLTLIFITAVIAACFGAVIVACFQTVRHWEEDRQ
jgi:hypothetical protein